MYEISKGLNYEAYYLINYRFAQQRSFLTCVDTPSQKVSLSLNNQRRLKRTFKTNDRWNDMIVKRNLCISQFQLQSKCPTPGIDNRVDKCPAVARGGGGRLGAAGID